MIHDEFAPREMLKDNPPDCVGHNPTASLVLCSVLVLAGGIVFASAALAMLFETWNPCSLIGGAVILPLPATLVIQQYRGTFRRNAGAASMSAALLFVIGGFAMLIFAMSLGQVMFDNLQIPMSFLLSLLVIGGVNCLAGWINLRWSQRLKLSGPSGVGTSIQASFSLRELLGFVTAIACVTALTAYLVRSNPPQFAENVSRDFAPFGLPPDARDVSFCRGVRGTIAYEFTVGESQFEAWVESGIGSLESDAAKVSVKPIIAPYTIRRYFALTTNLAGPESITITDGLYYQWNKQDRGVYAAFDRTTHRAYYFAHFH